MMENILKIYIFAQKPRIVTGILLAFFLLFPAINSKAESFRTTVEGSIEITSDKPAGGSASLGINSSVLIIMGAEKRFLRGIEIELSAPQIWIGNRGAVVMAVYNDIDPKTAAGVADMDGRRIAFDPLPNKLQIVYQIPLQQSHGLRTTPYVTVPAGVTPVETFPLLLRLMPVIKGLQEEVENMKFNLIVRPILSDEGAVKLTVRYPQQLRNRPFTVLIDDDVITSLSDQYVLKEGEHHLVILSEDYRNESRSFFVERAKILDLVIELQDPTPLIIFEGPQNAQIFLNNAPIVRNREPVPVEPGQHEAKFQIGDYTIIKTLNIQRGKTYRVVLDIDLTIHEED
ncbi:MAG: hypothetical protein LBI04_01170 [Treponema sp.]|jgi:hypothetical protein|nr:hypothetical protein [Treponema sp.]